LHVQLDVDLALHALHRDLERRQADRAPRAHDVGDEIDAEGGAGHAGASTGVVNRCSPIARGLGVSAGLSPGPRIKWKTCPDPGFAEISQEGKTLHLRGTHVEGKATLQEAKSATAAFGKDGGASEEIIQGGTRTTGANPGHIPRPIRVVVDK
jgi:hypothetical protein